MPVLIKEQSLKKIAKYQNSNFGASCFIYESK